MKLLKRLLIWLCIVFILLWIAAAVYVRLYGKTILEEALERSLKRDVIIASLSFQFPLGVEANRVRVKDFLEAQRVNAQFTLDSLWKRRFHIRNLQIHGGQIQYFHKASEEKFSFLVDEVQLRAGHLIFPLEPVQTQFEVLGRVAKEGSPFDGSRVEGSGWIDLAKRDMEARVKLTEADDRAGLTANVISKNNDAKVTGNVNVHSLLAGIQDKENPGGGQEAFSVNNLILGAISSLGVEIDAQFSFETKLDDFQLNNVSFSGNVISPDF